MVKGVIMDVPGIIVAVVAVYGAGLSTYNLIQSNKEKRRQISISIAGEYQPYLGGKRFEEQELLFTITNPGYRTVSIYSPWIEISKHKGLLCKLL